MSDQLDSRVTKLEVRVDGHDKEIAKVNSQVDALGKTLDAIKNNLSTIKWVVIGAVGAYAVQIVGAKDFLKTFISLLI
jgi:hypothetical protein